MSKHTEYQVVKRTKQRSILDGYNDAKPTPQKDNLWYVVLVIVFLVAIWLFTEPFPAFTKSTPVTANSVALELTIPSGVQIEVSNDAPQWAAPESGAHEYRIVSIPENLLIESTVVEPANVPAAEIPKLAPLPGSPAIPDDSLNSLSIDVTQQTVPNVATTSSSSATTFDTRCLTDQGRVTLSNDGLSFYFINGVKDLSYFVDPTKYGLPAYATLWKTPYGGLAGCIPPGMNFTPNGLLNNETGAVLPFPKLNP